MNSESKSKNTRVLRQNEKYLSNIEYREYDFPSNALPNLTSDDFGRPIACILREKTYTKSNNISCYFELTDNKFKGKKIILTVIPSREYKPLHSSLDMRKVPIDSKMSIVLGQGAKYIAWLRASVMVDTAA